MTESPLIREYLEFREKLRGDSARTVKTAGRICRSWWGFVEDLEYRTIETAGAEDLLSFIAQRETDGVADATIRGELCIIRSLYEYLVEHRRVHLSPAASLPRMICRPTLEKNYLKVDECLRILSNLDTSESLGLRNYVIIALLWSTGLRSQELCCLRWQDIDLDDGTVFVREGKGGKQRQIYLNDRILSDLRIYRKSTMAAESDPIFPGAGTKNNSPLSASRLVEITRESARKAGLAKQVGPLSFRHTFATHMFEAGVALEDIKELMGHAELSETTIYIHVSLDAAKQLLNDHIAEPSKYRQQR